tara:strand:- start:705 stop:1085 length:381 start_codon:yes stop_codon:yes gene_type:complete
MMPYVEYRLGQSSLFARNEGPKVALSRIFSNAKWFDVMRANPIECRMKERCEILAVFSCVPWTNRGATKLAKESNDELSAMDIPTLIYNIAEDLSDLIHVANHLKYLIPNSVRKFIPYGVRFMLRE